jgi:hypothetical protein
MDAMRYLRLGICELLVDRMDGWMKILAKLENSWNMKRTSAFAQREEGGRFGTMSVGADGAG